MKPVVFFSINEGLFFWNGQHGVMIDYLFDNLVTAWSDMPDTTHKRMLEHTGEFSREHTLLFTHGHSDHYSPKHVQEHAELYVSGIYGAGIPESNLLPQPLAQGDVRLELPGYQIIALKTRHQGTGDVSEIENTALCLEAEGCWYLHCGDSMLDDTLLAKLANYHVHSLEAVFANYYHIVPEDQRDFLKRLDAKHTFAIHFPFAKNDEYHIKQRLTRFLKNASDPFLKKMVLPKPMSRIL